MSRFEGGLYGLKANPSTCTDDQNSRHARHCSCRTPHSSSCAIWAAASQDGWAA